MPLPVIAGLASYVARKGAVKAAKKYGDKAVKAYLKNKNKKTGNWKGRQTSKEDLAKPLKKNKDGKTYSVMGRSNVVKRDVTKVAQGAAGGAAGALTIKNNKNKPSGFEKAFSAAHNAGKKTFTFKGKSYSTDVKKGK